MELWILLTIFTALTLSIVNVIDKFVLSKIVKNPYVPAIYLGALSFIIGIIILIWRGQSLNWLNLILALISGALYCISTILYFHAVKREEISRVVPLFYLNIIFVALLGAWWFGEIFTIMTYIGIFLLIAGAILINFKDRLAMGAAFWIMLISAFFLALSRILMKYVLISADYWTTFAWGRIGMFIVCIPLIFLYLKDFRNSFSSAVILSSSEILNILGVLLLTAAVSLAPVTLVGSLTTLQPLFLFLITLLISYFKPNIIFEQLKGKQILIKAVSIIMIIVGVILIL
jgi:transporter family protein